MPDARPGGGPGGSQDRVVQETSLRRSFIAAGRGSRDAVRPAETSQRKLGDRCESGAGRGQNLTRHCILCIRFDDRTVDLAGTAAVGTTGSK